MILTHESESQEDQFDGQKLKAKNLVILSL
jgi:hypothetical protein